MQAWSKISRMPANNIKKLQDELLCKIVQDQIAANHPYYSSLFKREGIEPTLIKGSSDLDKIPFTTKQDLLPGEVDPQRAKQFILQKPEGLEGAPKPKMLGLFGRKCAEPDPAEYKMSQLFYTKGNDVAPIPIVYTRYDLNNLEETGMRLNDVLNLKRDDTILNAFSYAPHVSVWQLFHAAMTIGSTALHSGGGRVLGMEKIILALNNMGAPVLASHPSFILAALQTMLRQSTDAPSLERIIIGMDYAPMVVVERIRDLMLQCKAADNLVQRIYFLSMAKSGFAECSPGFGYHLNPDHVLVEVINPQNGEILGEGERGEIVITNLDSRGTLVLRYRTGDITTEGLTSEPCPNCGRTVPRILGDIEHEHDYYDLKSEDAVIVFNGNALRRYMAGRKDVLAWYAEIVNEKGHNSLNIILKPAGGINVEDLAKILQKDIEQEHGLTATVNKGSYEAITKKIDLESGISVKQIFDQRRQD
jgi:phenylacetate-CoA ligase